MDQIPEQAIFIIVFLIIGVVRWFLENRALRNQPPEAEVWEEQDFIERASPIAPNRSSGGLDELYSQARQEIQERQSSPPTPESVQEMLREYQQPKAVVPPPIPTLATLPTLPRQQPALPPQQERLKAAPRMPSKAASSSTNAYELKKVRRPVLTAAQQQAIVNFEQMGQKRQPLGESNSRIRQLLQNPQSARDAIILSEILGKPKGA